MNIEKTVALLSDADDAYYNSAEPILSDAEYDELKYFAKVLFPNHDYFKRVGAAPTGQFPKKKHRIPMGSIENFVADSPASFITDIISAAKKWRVGVHGRILAQPKLDGLSVNLEYEEGQLVRALLRGDGYEGEDIFGNVIRMCGVLMELPVEIQNVRSEIVLPKKNLAKINVFQEEIGERMYANCRNAASGIARRLDGKYSEYLEVIAFDIVAPKEKDSDLINKMYGINHVPTDTLVYPDQIAEYYRKLMHDRDELPWDIDGAVIKADLMEDRDKLLEDGGNEMLPPWIRAMKFPAEERLFKVDDIRWFVGKTGKLSPVLRNLAGVQFAAKVVREVTLHNYSYFCRYKIAKGDKISVAIAGDVIPKIEDVKERSGNLPFEAPKECPDCGSLLRIEETFLWCDAAGCPGRIKALINAHVKEMGIEEVGPELVEKLFMAGKKGLIKFDHFPDLYSLAKKDLMKIAGFADRSAEKIVENIRAKMEPLLPVFVASLGIPGIGVRIIEKIGVKTLDELMKLSVSAMERVDGVGEQTANHIKIGLDGFYHLIGRMLANGVKIKVEKKVAAKSNRLGGKSFCFTGDIKELNPDTGKAWEREEAWALVEENGGAVKSGVSKKLDVLVLADMSSGSGKARKAKQYGVEMISSVEFFKRCRIN